MSSENGEKKVFKMRDFLGELEKYNVIQSSSEKKVSLIIYDRDGNKQERTIENFVCHLSQDRFQEDRDNSGRLNLGFSDSSIGAEEIETVMLIVRLGTESCFPLKYVGAMRCWLLGEYKVRKQKAKEEQEVEEEEGVEEKREVKDWFPGITCRFSRELRDNLDRVVANGAVSIEVRMKKEEA